ncbi:MAG: ABC transporter permease [Candidatus Bipolaricaulota bacterium]|nr:ABC transporter permease [Candidatus Bipolaricaulota bacterium]
MNRALIFSAIIEDSWRESWARRASLVVSLIALALLLLFAFGVGVRPDEAQPDLIRVSLFGVELRELPISKDVFANVIEITALGLANPWGIFLGLFITIGLFSGVFARGRIDLVLSKPIARWELYLARYLGGVVLVGVTTMLFFIGTWVLLWLKVGTTDLGLIWAGVVIVFLFAVLYSFAAFLALVTEGTGAALVATIVLWGLAEFAYARAILRQLSPTLGDIADVIYYLLPKTNDLEMVTARLVGAEQFLTDIGGASSAGFAFWTSGLFAVVMLALGIYLFSRKDY